MYMKRLTLNLIIQFSLCFQFNLRNPNASIDFVFSNGLMVRHCPLLADQLQLRYQLH